jgi:hypothetical protein
MRGWIVAPAGGRSGAVLLPQWCADCFRRRCIYGEYRCIIISGREARAPSVAFVSLYVPYMLYTWVLHFSRFYKLISTFYGTHENSGAT